MVSLALAWRLTPLQRLARRCWEGECVVFNDVTGDTHLLGDEALTILAHLASRPADGHSLQLLFGGNFGAEENEEFLELLRHLGQLELIEPCPP